MNNLNYIESKGFRIKGRYIYKASKLSKVIGKLNDTNFYFFSDNVHPFNTGINYFDKTTLTDGKAYKNYIHKAKENDRTDFNADFEDYINATKRSSVFQTYLNDQTRNHLSKNAINYFDLRGIADGYLKDSVCFPFFDYDGNFKSAQIIRYQENGKRVKEGFNTNWFHSYKNIKKSLGLKSEDKYSVKMDCFFGENYLKGSDNIVGIVEAPKTAVILKEIYPNIDWIATAGQNNLKSKKLELLENRKVILFPDAQTTQWQKIGGEYGFNVCNILDEHNAEDGSDLADYIFDSSFSGYSEIHEYLFSINDGDFNFEIDASALIFDFKRVSDEPYYFTAVPYFYKGEKVLTQVDNSDKKNIIFKGKDFDIYSEKYQVLNAQIDWHKQDTKNEFGKLEGFNEVSFKFHLQKCFRILKELNPKCYKGIFKKTLKALKKDSNFNFNFKYVINVLVPIWDSWNEDLTRFQKHRNWKYKRAEQIARTDFATFLNDDRYRSKLIIRLEAFQDAVKENRFIDYGTDLALSKDSKQRGYSETIDLVKQWNADVIGAKTLKTWTAKNDFFNKLQTDTKSSPLYNRGIYRVANKMYQNFSYREIAEISEVKNFATIKKYLDFKPCRDTETQIKKRITFLIDSITDIEPIRMAVNGRTRIVGFKKIQRVNEQAFLYEKRCEWSSAFGLPAEDRRQGRTAEVLLRWSIQKLQRESQPAEALKKELKYLNLLYIKQMNDKQTDSRTINISDYQKEDSILNVNDFIPLDAVNF